MKRFILRRMMLTVGVLFITATLLFFLFRMAPGSPTAGYISTALTGDVIEAVRASFGLDKPLYLQYLLWFKNFFSGNMGQSFIYHQPVMDLILDRLPNTLALTLPALMLAYVFGASIGVWLAWKQGSRLENPSLFLVLMTRSAPVFWTGMMALVVFSFQWRWLPISGMASPGEIFPSKFHLFFSLDFLRHMILPMMTMAVYFIGLPLLLMRSSMLETLGENFIQMCRIVGMSERRIMFKHAARNALLPIVTSMAIGIGLAISGSVVVEVVFGWPGMGRLMVSAVETSDYPLAQGLFFTMAVIIVLMNFVADLLYGWLDPRVSYEQN